MYGNFNVDFNILNWAATAKPEIPRKQPLIV